MRNYLPQCALLATMAACSSGPSTGAATSAITDMGSADGSAAQSFETYDADGVAVVIYNTISCPDVNQPCSGLVETAVRSQDGATQLNLTEDSDYFVTHADVNGVLVQGATLDDIRINAAAIGLPIDGMLDTVSSYFVNMADKTLKEKIACVMKALGLGGKLTATTFSCSFCFATVMGAELGPPDWLAGIASCSACAKLTGKSIAGLFDLIKTCSTNGAVATDVTDAGIGSADTGSATTTTTDTSATGSADTTTITDPSGSGSASGSADTDPPGGDGDSTITYDDAGSGAVDGAGSAAASGDVLYHVYWYGEGFTTLVADYYFNKERSKVVAACAAAGGVLKNEKWDTSGIGYYKNEGWADCVKK